MNITATSSQSSVTPSTPPLSLQDSTPEAEYESRIANLTSAPAQCTTDYFSWRQLTDLSQKMLEHEEKYGAVTASYMGDCVVLGTEHGIVLVMDYLGRVKAALGKGGSQTTASFGSVSSVAFSADYTALVAGYSLGHVAVWDWVKGTTISVSRPLTDNDSPDIVGHPEGTAVMFVGFISASKHRYISAGAAGHVFYHHIVRRLLTTMNTIQLTSPGEDIIGGDVLFEATSLPYGKYPCPADGMGLVAVLTSDNLSIYKTRHGVERQYKLTYQQLTQSSNLETTRAHRRVFTKRPYAGSACWLPAFALGKSNNTSEEDQPDYSPPQLAFSWGDTITVLTVNFDHNVAPNGAPLFLSAVSAGLGQKMDRSSLVRTKFTPFLSWNAVEDVVFCRWIDINTLLYMTQSQRMFVLETVPKQETEICSAPPGTIGGHPWATLATGVEAEASYASAISVYKRRMFTICGTSNNTSLSVYTGRLLTWSERLTILMDQGQLINAIALAVGFYRGQTAQITVGLPKSQQQQQQNLGDDSAISRRQTLVGRKLVELIRESLKQTFSRRQQQQQVVPLSDSVVRSLASVCVEACLAIDNQALLFGEIYDRYAARSKRHLIFLEVLEPYILSGKITHLPPQTLNAMVDSYGTTPQLVRRLGELLSCLQLSPGEFDIDRVLSSCRRHRLWRTFARVWLSMGDPIAPVTSILSSAVEGNDEDELAEDSETPAVVIFEYLDMVVRGRYYPDGKAIKPQSLAEKYSTMATELILPPVDTNVVGQSSSTTILRSTYQMLLALLDLDTRRMLATLDGVIRDPFTGYINLIIRPPASKNGTVESKGDGNDGGGRSLRRASQVKTFLQIVVDTMFVLTTRSSTQEDGKLLSKQQVGLLSSFALTLYATRFPLIYLTDECLSQWTQLLLQLDDDSTREEREDAFDMVFKLSPPSSYADYIERTRNAGFFRVLEYIYHALGQYKEALQTYLDNSDYKSRRSVFIAIRELASKPTAGVMPGIKAFVEANAVELTEIDAQVFVDAVDSMAELEHDPILEVLSAQNSQTQLAYLRALLDPAVTSSTSTPDTVNVDERLPPNIGLSDEQHMVVYPFRSLIPDSKQQGNKHPQAYHERYLELLCQFKPGDVLEYLKRYADSAPEPFRLTYVQTICERHGVSDGLVWTLQRLGDFSGALATLLAAIGQVDGSIRSMILLEISNDTDEGISDADKERLTEQLATMERNANGCVSVCRAALSKFSKDAEAVATNTATTAKVQNDYQVQVCSQLCDLWLALLSKTLGYLHSTNRALDDSAGKDMVAKQQAWELVYKRQRWMLHHVLDALISAASSASSLISLRQIIQQLILTSGTKDEDGDGAKQERSLEIAEIQHLVATAVSSYKTEAQLMELTNVLVDYDLFTIFAQLMRSRKQGWMVQSASKATDSLCCNQCGQPLFVDQRQEQAMAEMRKQTTQYFGTNSLRVLDLHVFEDQSAQWQWIKLRNASAAYDDQAAAAAKKSRRSTSAGGGSGRVILFKCGHRYHQGCCRSSLAADANCQICSKKRT